MNSNHTLRIGMVRAAVVCLGLATSLVVGTPAAAEDVDEPVGLSSSTTVVLPSEPEAEQVSMELGSDEPTVVASNDDRDEDEQDDGAEAGSDVDDGDSSASQDAVDVDQPEATDAGDNLAQDPESPAIEGDESAATDEDPNGPAEASQSDNADDPIPTEATSGTEDAADIPVEQANEEPAAEAASAHAVELPTTVTSQKPSATAPAKTAATSRQTASAASATSSGTRSASTTKQKASAARTTKTAMAKKKAATKTKAKAKVTVVSRTATSSKTVVVPLNAFALETGLSYGSVGDVKGGSSLNRANIQLWRSNNSGAQRWRLERHGSGYYVVNVATGKVLDIAGGTAKKGTNVQLYAKNGSKAQLWMPVRQKGGGWVLKSLLGGGLVLDVSGGSSKNGANLQVWTANGSKAQMFWLRESNPELERQARTIDDGAYLIVSSGVSQVLDTKGSKLANGVNIQLHASNGGNAQKFWATYADGFYTFQNTATGLALDVEKGSPVAGSNVRLYRPNHSAGQQWSVVANKDGSFRLVNRAGGLSLDIAGGKRANGSNVQGYYRNSSVAQAWTFRPTSLLSDGTYLITEVGASGQALDAGSGAKDGSAVTCADSERDMAQRFRVRNLGKDSVEVRSVASGLWLSDRGSAVVQSTSKDSWKLVWGGSGLTLSNGSKRLGFSSAHRAITQTAKAATRLSFEKTTLVEPGYYALESLVGTSLDVRDASRSRANAQMGTKASSQSKTWYFTSLGSDRYIITNLRSGLVLSSEHDAAAENTNVIQARYESLQGQVWQAKWDEGTGAIVLVNTKSGKPLDIAGGSSAAGANVRQHTANGTKAQSWRLSERKAPALTSLQRAVVSAAKHTASPGGGLCALWVTNVFDNAGIGHWEGDACDQYDWFCDDYNRASLRTGMIVAVSSHSHTWAGSIWGHVAIYIGNGKVMDNVGYVRTKKLSDWLAWYGDTVTPMWGWFGGRWLV